MKRVAACIAVAAVLSPAAAYAGHHRVATIDDPRITESSGLALAAKHPGLLYTLNDSGNTPQVYALDRRSGDVVGVTTLDGYTLSDTEALGVSADGTLWVADIGDNAGDRHDIALYRMPEPGRGDASVTPKRYRLRYPDGPKDAETVLVGPHSYPIYVVAKGVTGGRVYRLGRHPRTTGVNLLHPLRGVGVPALITDGSFSADGSTIVLRSYGSAFGYDPDSWRQSWSKSLPAQRQGESLTLERNDRSMLIGTEGRPSPILRVRVPRTDTAHQTGDDDASQTSDPTAQQTGLVLKILGVLLIVLAVLIVWLVIAARKSRREHAATQRRD